MPLSSTRRKQIAWVAAAVVCIALAAAAMGWAAKPLAVQVVQPSRGLAVRAVYATGTVEAGVTVRIAPRVAARLVELRVDEGEHVVAGQRLARLDDRDLRSVVAEAEAKARYAESQFARIENLARHGFATRDRVEQARAEQDAARAAVTRAREQVGFMSLTAPTAGVVIRRDGEVGDFVAVNQPLFFLAADGAPPRVDADVDEEDVIWLKPGQTVLVKADAFPDRVFEGTVAEITPKGDPLTRSYRVRVRLPASVPLKIGMTAETNIIVEERHDALTVPASALRKDGIWRVKNGQLDLVQVQVGVKGPDKVEILRGLGESEWIVAGAEGEFRQGQRVRTKQPNGGKS
jgi:RND family efflux transporter MFP subunit